MSSRINVVFTLLLMALFSTGAAVVKFEDGRRVIRGVQLLQDNKNPSEFYYVPQLPRLAIVSDSTFEFLCIKYVGPTKELSGGLFHALVEFTLHEDSVKAIQKELETQVAGARVVGPVPLMETIKDGQEGVGSFQIVSAVLSNQEGEGAFTRTVITSGHAPLLPGSKSAIAALLDQSGATLLWASMQGPTSDVSVSIDAYYEAVLEAYNAIVSAEMSAIYQHFSRVRNVQEHYTKRQLRKIYDELRREGTLKVEVFDRSKGLGISSGNMESIMNAVTEKLTALMFDTESGWAKAPEREAAVEQNQLAGRQSRGFFGSLFCGSGNQAYISDDQYTMKKREDIQTNKFYLNLSQSTTLKVPVRTSGNLKGLFSVLGNDSRYFKTIDMNDRDFQRREIQFVIDKEYVDAFTDLINFVSISFRKRYGSGQPDFTDELNFPYHLIKNGQLLQKISYPRLGIGSSDWLNYEYKLSWGITGQEEPLRFPSKADDWIQSSDASIQLNPPFKKRIVEIDADRAVLKDLEVNSATIDFATILNGKPEKLRTVIIRAGDSEPTRKISLYHDPEGECVYKATWYSTKKGTVEQPITLLEGDYLYLAPPSPEEFNHSKP